MSIDPKQLMNGFLDDILTEEQHAAFEHWLQASPDHAKEFAALVMLHDQLRNRLTVIEPNSAIVPAVEHQRRYMPVRSYLALSTACLLLLSAVFVWHVFVANPLSAATVELERIISASAQYSDCTYAVTVESVTIDPKHMEQEAVPDHGRPPKPPLNGARLHVRGAKQFVLERTTVDGSTFVTGCNGLVSWAVRPDGPVRVSKDLERFNRDVPGHEHSMPLNNIHESLEQLRTAYDIQLVPIGDRVNGDIAKEVECRMLAAVKKRGVRGPNRIEITYSSQSGQLKQLRFVDMPYGPERLILRMTLVGQEDLGPNYFDHDAHHKPNRIVEFED
ncbi:MAG: FecR/PupR family sigma factor regulator [Planctomycetaceae bacterium]